jgi:hypothetical protein
MARVRVQRSFSASVHEAQTYWCDVSRWPEWMDGVAQIVSVDERWPAPGSRVIWQSGSAGRGRVTERVVDCEALAGLTVTVEDEAMTGTQRVDFEPAPAGVQVGLTLEYRIRRRGPFTPLVEWLFVRRPMTDSLTRTLERFGGILGSV